MKRCLPLLVLVSAVAAGDDKPPKVKLSADEKALVELLNKERKKEKLAELVVDPLLCKVARKHSENMATQETCKHELDGKKVGARAADAGYDYQVIGENLAMAAAEDDTDPPAPKPAEIHQKWMDSKGHRANILNPKYREVGLSMTRSKKGTYFYTQVFATRAE